MDKKNVFKIVTLLTASELAGQGLVKIAEAKSVTQNVPATRCVGSSFSSASKFYYSSVRTTYTYKVKRLKEGDIVNLEDIPDKKIYKGDQIIVEASNSGSWSGKLAVVDARYPAATSPTCGKVCQPSMSACGSCACS